MRSTLILAILIGIPMLGRAAGLSDLPVGCYEKREFPCAIQLEITQEMKLAHGELAGERGTQMVLLSAESIQLIKGQIWVSGIKGNIRFGEVRFVPERAALFSRGEKGKMLAWALDGSVRVLDPRGEQPTLGPGFTNWYLGLGKSQDVQQGILQASEVKSLARRLVSVWGSKADEHKSDFARYRDQQKVAQAAAGDIYQQVIVLRQVAAAKEEESRQLKMRKSEDEKNRFRKMFRAKYFEGLDPES